MHIKGHLKRLRPTRIDYYLLTEVLGPLTGGTIFFVFVFMMFQALRLAEFFIIHGIAAGILAKMATLLALSFVPTALPVAFLIAMLVAFGRLSSDSELVAMKASGLSLLRLSIPPMFAALLVVVLSIGLNLEWAPWGEKEFKSTLIKVSNTKVVSSIKQGTFNSGFFDLLIFADKVDPKTNRLERVFIYDEREAKNPLTVVAAWGELVQVKTGTELGAAAMLKLHDGSIHHNNPAESNYQKIDFGDYNLYLKVEEGAGNSTMKPRLYTQSELKHRITQIPFESGESLELRGEYWRRYAVALSPFFFVFLGIGFGTVRTRAVRAGAVLISFVVLLVYWGAQTMSAVLMQRGIVPPYVAMELPNLIIAVIGGIAFKRAAW